ncbi:MAG TPA: NAD(P)H-dependent dehydrogenase/reductase [Desulfuromonadales bacterium]|nr:NAD(P)H-dependent dehydrogenase/reductase [Desulfuromonadales bacterium]
MIELLRKRRSIRKYLTTSVDQKSLDILIESLLLAPSSRNNKPGNFVVVENRELLEKLSQAKEHGSAFLKGAPLGIVVCADTTKSDVWVEDCAIASILLQVTAESLGLGSCWIQIRKRAHDSQKSAEEYIKELLDLPEKFRVVSIISIGHPDEIKTPHQSNDLDCNKIMMK